MRKPIGLLLGLCLAGVLVVVIAAASSERPEAFSLGVTPAGGVAKLEAGDRVCQGAISIPDDAADFDRVVVALGTYQRRGSELALTIVTTGAGHTIARGRIAPGYTDIAKTATHSVPVGHVDTREPFIVCLRNAGPQPVAIYGNGDASSRTSTAVVNDKPINADIYLSFQRAEPRSALSLLGTIFDRAALWRASWVGSWFLIVLALLVVAGVPALVAVALRDAARG